MIGYTPFWLKLETHTLDTQSLLSKSNFTLIKKILTELVVENNE